MKFIGVPLMGAYIVELEPVVNERGFFARCWCRQEFLTHGLHPRLPPWSISFN